MLKETHQKSEQILENERLMMSIDSLDVVTSYMSKFQELKIAISIADFYGYPVYGSEVELLISSPNGIKYILVNLTDSYGIATFELENVESGRWDWIISKVNHPDYVIDATCDQLRWFTTYV